MKPITDDFIVREVLAGRKEAYAHVVDRYKKPLYNLAYRMTLSAEDALDLSQETFVRAYAKLHTYQPGKSLFAWLYTICLNLTRNHLGKKRELPAESEDALGRRTTEGGNCDPSPEELMTEREKIRWLEKGLQRLPVELREAVVLRYMQELPFEEVSRVLGISLSATKMRVYRGLERLREVMHYKEMIHGL
jgi:RNA polymerase sigma-70 factor (ECF subfamily)